MNRSTPSSLGSINPAKAAFTLIEIVLVIAIIAILGAAAINLIKGNVDVAKETRVESDIKNIVTQLKVYESRNLAPKHRTGSEGPRGTAHGGTHP